MSDANAIIIIYTTVPSENEAQRIGGKLVEEKLAACINIFPGMMPVYRWEGKIETGTETAMLIKTRKSLQHRVFEAIAAEHPYTVPALLAVEPVAVAASYAAWLCDQTLASG